MKSRVNFYDNSHNRTGRYFASQIFSKIFFAKKKKMKELGRRIGVNREVDTIYLVVVHNDCRVYREPPKFSRFFFQICFFEYSNTKIKKKPKESSTRNSHTVLFCWYMFFLINLCGHFVYMVDYITYDRFAIEIWVVKNQKCLIEFISINYKKKYHNIETKDLFFYFRQCSLRLFRERIVSFKTGFFFIICKFF